MEENKNKLYEQAPELSEPVESAENTNPDSLSFNDTFNQMFGGVPGAEAAQNQPVPDYDGSVSAAAIASEERKEKSFVPMIAALLLIMAAAGILLFIFVFKGGNGSYEKAERRFLENGMSAYSEAYGVMGQAQGGELNVTVAPEEYLLNMLGITDINPTTFTVKSSLTDTDKLFAEYIYKNGNQETLTLDVWVNGGDVIMLIPQLSEYYFTAKADVSGINLATMPELPSEDDIQKIYDAVLNEYFALTKDAPIEKDVEVSLGDITVKSDMTEIAIDLEMSLKLSVTLLQAVKDNRAVKNFITESGIYGESLTGEKLPESFDIDAYLDDAINGAKTKLEDLQSGDEENYVVMNMKVYVNGENIVKREIAFTEEGETVLTLTYTDLLSKDRYEREFVLKSNENDGSLKISDSGEEVKGAYSGKVKFTLNNATDTYKMTLDYSNVTKNDNRIGGGDFTLRSEDFGEYSFTVKLTLKDGALSGNLEVAGQKVASVDINWEEGYKGKAVPDVNGSNSIDMNDAENDERIDGISLNLMELIGNLADDNGKFDLIGYLLQFYSAFNTVNYTDYYPVVDDDYGYSFDQEAVNAIIGGSDGPAFIY